MSWSAKETLTSCSVIVSLTLSKSVMNAPYLSSRDCQREPYLELECRVPQDALLSAQALHLRLQPHLIFRLHLQLQGKCVVADFRVEGVQRRWAGSCPFQGGGECRGTGLANAFCSAFFWDRTDPTAVLGPAGCQDSNSLQGCVR